MKKIELESWERREIYDFFSRQSQPFYAVTFRLDVTELRRFCRERALSFYYALIYLATCAVNETEAFLYTLRDGELFLLDRREPSFTDRLEDEKYFHIVTLPLCGTLADFCAAAEVKSRTQKGFIDFSAESGELIYFSSLPWLDLSALNNERDLDRGDAVPRIAWGRYTEHDGRLSLGMSVEVNHRFVDGADIGAFAARLEERIAAL